MTLSTGVLLLLAVTIPPTSGPGSSAWAPGRWAVYRLKVGHSRVHFMRLAVVRQLESRQPGGLWLELELGTDPDFAAPLSRMRMAVGGGSVSVVSGMDLPTEVGPIREALQGPEAKQPSGMLLTPGRMTRLRTHAGELDAVPVNWSIGPHVVKRLWTSAQLPFWGLARWELPAVGRSIEIWRFGEGAVARFDAPQSLQSLETEGAAR